jgi:branched-chain amino acid transport system ATP-binding protein
VAALLQLETLSVKYGAIEALRDLSLTVEEGSITCLIGANGAGKSTTVNAIAGLVPAAAGRVLFQGQEITRLPASRRIGMGIAIALEGRKVFGDQTVLDNLMLGAYTHSAGSLTKLRREAEAMLKRFPLIAERGAQLAGTLSGGQQQALAIARALMARPKLLLLDEPSLGLAPILIKEIYQIIRDLAREGTTILLVEQFAAYAFAVSQTGCVLEHGHLVLEGPVSQIQDDPRLAKAYLGH